MKDIRSHDDPRRLTDLLKAAVPESPDPAGRAGHVVRRAKHANRRRGATGALAVGVAAAAVIVTPHFIDSSPVSNDATSPSPTVRPAHPYECTSAGRTSGSLEPVRTGRVPLGAVLARICEKSTHRSGTGRTVAWYAPGDALTTNVDAVAAAFNRAPAAQDIVCPDRDRGRGFTLTFQYSDGHLVRLSGVAQVTCDFATLHGTSGLGRFAGTPVLRAFLAELASQRSHQTPPPLSQLTPLTCLPSGLEVHSLMPVGRTLDLQQAIVCDYTGLAFPARLNAEGRFTSAEVQMINRDYAATVTSRIPPGATCMNPVPPDTRIIGQDAWGDVVELATSCYVYTPVVRSQPQLFWPISERVSKMISTVLRPR